MTKRPEVISFAMNHDLDLLNEIEASPYVTGNEACLDSDPDLFFSDFAEDIREAKAICSFCPQVETCAAYGLKQENYGVWGGLSAAERYKIRGNRDALDQTDIDHMLEDKNQLLYSPLEDLAKMYGVDTRTIIRWRELLRKNLRAS